MTNDEYLAAQEQIGMFARLARGIALDEFIEQAERGLSHGAIFAPWHFIAGQDKLELIVRMARALRAFQAILPTEDEARKLDADATARRERLGV